MIILQTRNTIASKGSSSKPVPVGLTVGIVVGVVGFILLLTRLLAAAKREGSRDREPEEGISMGSTQAQRNRDRTSHQERRHTDLEPLPAYEARATSQLVRPTDVSYDAPAAFELAEQIAAAERMSVAPSMAAAVPERSRLPLMKRMAQVQHALNELNQLAAETPAEGYPPHSIQALKIVQLKQNIALMSDLGEGPEYQPEGLTRQLSDHSFGRPIERSLESPLPKTNTLHARMVEIQQLLGEVDRIMAQPPSLETSMQLQSLRTRISELAEAEPAPGPSSSSTGPSFPEPAHIAMVGHSIAGPSRSSAVHGEGQTGVGEGGSGRPSGSGAIPGPRELPPPYKAVVRDSTDDCAGPGATSVR